MTGTGALSRSRRNAVWLEARRQAAGRAKGPMTGASTDLGIIGGRAAALYAWLLERPGGALPQSVDILLALPELRSGSGVSRAFLSLARQGRIEQRHGTRRHGRGHRIVRIVATGTVLQTAGCPLTFDHPQGQRSRKVADLTLWRVLKVVKDCADRGAAQPKPARLGARVGRSVLTVRLALNSLHDSGHLTLIQRGARWAAELPDGRSTL